MYTIVATEVIEHLDDDELHSFSTVVFGAYHPTVVVLLTTLKSVGLKSVGILIQSRDFP